MKRILLFAFLFCLSGWTAFPSEEKNELSLLYEKIKKMQISPQDATRVRSLSFPLDSASLSFEEGTFFWGEKVDGKVHAGVFMGKGRFGFVPPDPVEQAELEKYLEEKSINKEFREAFFLFSDDTYEKVMAKGEKGVASDKEVKQARSLFEKKFKELRAVAEGLFQGGGGNPFMGILYHRLMGLSPKDGFFLCEMKLKRIKGKDWLTYLYNPLMQEEVQLYRHWAYALNVEVQQGEILSSFQKAADRKRGDRENAYEDRRDFDVEHYTMNLKIYEDPYEKDFRIKSEVDLTLSSKRESLPGILLNLVNDELIGTGIRGKLTVKKVTESGQVLPHVHDLGQILLRPLKPLASGERRTFHFEYGGDIVRPLTPTTFSLLNTYPWYPMGDMGDRFTFDWTIRTPKPIVAGCSGTLVDMRDEGKDVMIRAQETIPSQIPSIIFGKYRVEENNPKPGQIKIRVFALPEDFISVEEYAAGGGGEGAGGGGGPSGPGEIAQEEVQPDEFSHGSFRGAGDFIIEGGAIVAFYEMLFGPFPFPELEIAQMFIGAGFGQAPPGLVQLDGAAFMSKTKLASLADTEVRLDWRNNINFRSELLAHEIAHQYWGHVASNKSARDYWFVESLAEYSAGLYIERLKGKNAFEKMLKSWQQHARNPKKTLPLWICFRADPDTNDYVRTIYNRGPLVLHMLRVSMGTKKFIEGLRKFADFARANGGDVSTEDFQKVMEETYGQKLDLFFADYIKGNRELLLK